MSREIGSGGFLFRYRRYLGEHIGFKTRILARMKAILGTLSNYGDSTRRNCV
jgi:hypothetical protein